VTSPRGAYGRLTGIVNGRPLARPIGHPVDLAVLRIYVFATVLATRDLRTAPGFAALSSSLRAPPEGLHAFSLLLPINVPIANGVLAIIVVASVLALVGLYTRASATVAALGMLYLLGIPQLYGTVRHYHHLVWLAAVLAASPCGDALSIDALRAARRGGALPAASVVYGIPLRATWLIVACIYFFAGYWKWKQSGLAWATSDNLIQQMRWKWLQNGSVPSLRLDLYPRLCTLFALVTMTFEVAFPFALFHRSARALVLFGALCFHAATAYFMYIYFGSLLCLYTAFVPWHRWLAAPWQRIVARASAPERRGISRTALPSLIVTVLVLAGAVQAGARGAVQAWPFACYPTFQWIAPDAMPVLELEWTDREGRVRTVDDRPASTAHGPAALDRQRRWALAWSLVRDPRRDAIEGWIELVKTSDPRVRDAASVRVYRGMRAVDPATWTEPALPRTLLYESR